MSLADKLTLARNQALYQESGVADAWNAIETKGGDVSNKDIGVMGQVISDLPIGGGGATIEKDVNFYDFDGTLLFSYTLDEVQALTELPQPPTNERLVFQEWNWALSDIKAFNRTLDVGATYTTKSGKSEFDLTLTAVTGLVVTMKFYNVTAGNTITVEWGDGASNNGSTTGVNTFTHTYATIGDYTASVNSFGTFYPYGTSTTPFNMFSVYPSFICRNIHLSDKCNQIGGSSFYGCRSLMNITFSKFLTGTTGSGGFAECYSLTKIILPLSASSFNGIGYLNTLNKIIVSANYKTMVNYQFTECFSLKRITLPNVVTTINAYAFSKCYSLTQIVIPASVISIGGNAFTDCFSIVMYKMLPITPPTLIAAIFNNINGICIIEVPKGSLQAYKTATNWSAYSNYMREATK